MLQSSNADFCIGILYKIRALSEGYTWPMKDYWLEGINKISENFPTSDFSPTPQPHFCIFLSWNCCCSPQSQQAASLTTSQKDPGRLSRIGSHESFRQMSYAGTLPYQKHHRGFHKHTTDITRIWLEQITNCQTAALPMVYGKGIKVKRECWEPVKNKKLSQLEQRMDRTVIESCWKYLNNLSMYEQFFRVYPSWVFKNLPIKH